MSEPLRSNRWFRHLSAPELTGAIGFGRRGVNAVRANREIRRRAALAGMTVEQWMRTVA